MSRSRRAARKRSRSQSRKARKKQEGWFRHSFIRSLGGIVALGTLCIITLTGGIIFFQYDLRAARYDMDAVGRIPIETRVPDANGGLIGYLHGENMGKPVPLESISPHFIEALLAREDSRFYHHNGIDKFGVVRAWIRNAKEKRTVQGASTITMQLSRMTYGLTGQTMERKLLEMAIARRIEKRYSKEEILSHYVNRVFLGTGMNGIEQAAQGYFAKSAAELTVPEAAMIAGVIRAPNGFSPFRHYETALREMRSTLRRMENEGVISKKETEQYLKARPLVQPQDRWMKMLRQHSKVSGQKHGISGC